MSRYELGTSRIRAKHFSTESTCSLGYSYLENILAEEGFFKHKQAWKSLRMCTIRCRKTEAETVVP